MVLPNVDNGYSKDRLTALGLPVLLRPREMLVDLAADPQEFENVVDEPEYAAVKADLETRLLDWMRRTNDPLLKGRVPPPSGARVTPWNEYNPEGGPKRIIKKFSHE